MSQRGSLYDLNMTQASEFARALHMAGLKSDLVLQLLLWPGVVVEMVRSAKAMMAPDYWARRSLPAVAGQTSLGRMPSGSVGWVYVSDLWHPVGELQRTVSAS